MSDLEYKACQIAVAHHIRTAGQAVAADCLRAAEKELTDALAIIQRMRKAQEAAA